jgi:putative hydrolase of HD superfamily
VLDIFKPSTYSDSIMKNSIHFLFEVGMLKKTPRSGFQFLGTGEESVAEHSFRTAIIGYLLARKDPRADPHKTILMCLFHDIHEGRTGDLNYVNKKYVQVDEEAAVHDLSQNLPFGGELIELIREYNAAESPEACISKDADQLDLILELKTQHDLGNKYAEEWLYYAIQRLTTENGKTMAQEILGTDSTDWWFEKKTELWVNNSENHKKIK